MKTITIEMPDDTALPFANSDEQLRTSCGSLPRYSGTTAA